jgi:hypothetical protein
MATSKKVSELTAATEATADDLLYLVNDPGGTPGSRKLTVKLFLESNAVSNSAIAGRAAANSFTATYTGTPANATNVPTGFPTGTMWSDGSYLYIVTGASALKRVAIATW